MSCEPEIFGADPANIRWAVVRGDTSTLKVEFLDNDEITYFDTSGWLFRASAYDRKTDIVDILTVDPYSGYVIVTVPANISSNWGTTYGGTVAELSFDLEVTLLDGSVWTPVIGTISVYGDVSGAL